MTWLKLSDEYGDQLDTVSDAAFRTMTEALVLMMRREQGPMIPRRLLMRNLNTPDPACAIRELAELGLIVENGAVVQIVAHVEHQPEPDVIAARKANTVVRVRRYRRRQAGLDPERTP